MWCTCQPVKVHSTPTLLPFFKDLQDSLLRVRHPHVVKSWVCWCLILLCTRTLEIFFFVVSGPHLAQLPCRRALQHKSLLMGGSSQMIPQLSLLLSIPSLVARYRNTLTEKHKLFHQHYACSQGLIHIWVNSENSRPWQQYPKLVMIQKPPSKRSENQLLTPKIHDNSFPFQTSLTIGYLSFMNKIRVYNCLFVHPFEITLLLTNLSSCSRMNWSKNSAFLFDLCTPTRAHRHCCADERQPFTEEVWNELSVTDLHLRKSWKRVHNHNLPRQREDSSFQKRSAILKPLDQTPIATVWHQNSTIMYSVVSAVDIYLPQDHVPNFITIWHIKPSENPQSNIISDPEEKSL